MTLLASWIDSVPTWLVLASLAAVAWTLLRGKAGEAVGILQQANEVLAGRVRELERETKEQAKTIAELQARTDFSVALKPLTESLRLHEEKSAARGERFERLLDVLDVLAQRLGPEPNGAH